MPRDSWLAHWILDEEGEPAEVDLYTWAVWFEKPGNRGVLQEYLPGHTWVSTVFLGIDHNFTGHGPEILWETMIFGGIWEMDYQARYSSKLAALEGHALAVRIVEQYYTAPRRLKKSLRKFWTDNWKHLSPALTRGDARRAEAALLTIGYEV